VSRAVVTSGLVAMALAACGGESSNNPGKAGEQLETAAIEAGLVAKAEDVTPVGAYGRGSDTACIVPNGSGFAIAIEVTYGEGINCSARGTASATGERLSIALDAKDGCRFDAQLSEGVLRLPGSVPEGCQALCDARASLSGLAVDKLSDLEAEARAMRGNDGSLMCAD
jgi:hypothetical protein